jgi:predicted flap endonuclease-1-like 5' DNA nuclease
MAVDLKTLKGMDDDILTKLAEKDIKTTEQLLAAVRSPVQRKELATHCGVASRDVLELGNRADLSRIKGVAGVYSDLLEQAGVDTVPELAQRRADNLHAKIVATNDEAGLTKQPPTADAVAAWVEQAKGLQRAIEY